MIKKLLLMMVASLLASNGMVRASEPYFKAETGLVGGALNGETAGFRVGSRYDCQSYYLPTFDYSLGWTRDMGYIDSDKVKSNGATVQTVGLKLKGRVWSSDMINLSLGGGIGYSTIDLDGRDKAEANVSWTYGAEAKFIASQDLDFIFGIEGQFLHTHTFRTDYSSHIETLSNGQQVEVLDENLYQNSLNFNSVKMLIGLIYKF